jgi:hypothetical protein
VDAGFLCDKAVVFRDMMDWTPMELASLL